LLARAKAAKDKATLEATFMVAALKGDGVADLKVWLAAHVAPGPWHYPPDQMSDATLRHLAAEITREKLFVRLHQELPYSLTVEIEQFTREPGLVRIGAVIWVERESQKHIVIGKGGKSLKQVGAEARKAIEELIGEKVFLETWVKVSRDWTRSENMLERMGFDS